MRCFSDNALARSQESVEQDCARERRRRSNQRYVGDTEEFTEGRGFKIIELNGVTSEATHIYDPQVGIADAYRALFEQWRLAFEIGAENRWRGASQTSLWRLMRLVITYRGQSQGHLIEIAASALRTINAPSHPEQGVHLAFQAVVATDQSDRGDTPRGTRCWRAAFQPSHSDYSWG